MESSQENPPPSTPTAPDDDASTPGPENAPSATAADTSNVVTTPVQPSGSQQPPNQLPPAQTAFSQGGQSHRNSIASTGPVSSWSASSDKQLGHNSVTSDLSDRVFPIRSVISVEPNHDRGADYFPSHSDSDSRGTPVHVLGHSRNKPSLDLRRSNTQSHQRTSPSPMPSHGGRPRRSTLSPMSSIQADAARHGSIAPIQLDIATSDKDEEEENESGPLGVPQPGRGRGDTVRDSTSASREPSIGAPHVTTRFTHMETEDGHSVITGRDGTLQRCEDEPIHTPGAVQGFGAMVALREERDGRFVARYVSENSEKLIGYSPKQLFRMSNFLDTLTEEQQDNLLDHIDFIRDEDSDPSINGPEVFSLSIRPPKQKSTKLWCAIHINPAHPDLIICEFELDDDQVNPLRPTDELTPDSPKDTLNANPTLEEIEESTEILSKPLRILRSARKRRGEQGAMQVFDIMSQVQEQLASAQSLDVFLKILVGIVKELTGFHRIMMYQFDSSFNGKVVTELVDASKTRDLYKGLHFPATDIPRQARELYKLNKVRLLYDRDLETARLVCRSKEDLETPLDMSHSYLRAMSPIHLKYLGNMAVRSSMSISVNAFNELWGLIACHSYGNQGMRVSFPIRKMCRLVGDTASRNIERLSYASRLQARKLINTAPTDKNPSGYIVASSDDLLRLFDADFGLLSIKGETKILGNMEQSQEALAMLEYLRVRKLTSVVASQDIREDFPDLRYPPGFQVIAGLLYVPLSVGGNDFIVFFRRGQIKEVKWAGNPYEKIVREGTAGYLEPRTSFQTWHETVIGKCREWNEEQVETSAVLCLVYGKFIEVWRQKEAAIQSSKLTRLLLANSAHEVRTPLNAIINYLEIALEGSLDNETRENLARSHSASKSLIYVINDLLDLTKTEEGQNLIKDETFELPMCITEATDAYYVDAKRKGIEYTVTLHPSLPRHVHGDGRRVRQAISNVTANAITHTNQGHVTVEVFVSEVREQTAVVDFVFTDSGSGMSTSQLDALFRDLEQVSTEESEPKSSPKPDDGSQRSMRTLGLGLAVVARTVRTMDGQLRLKSDEGQGSRFVVSLPFHLPSATPAEGEEDAVKGQVPQITQSSENVTSAPAGMNLAPEGEITLVDRGSAYNVNLGFDETTGEGASGRRSRHSIESHQSQGSQNSAKSDADRLIDAIQTPFSLHDKEPEYPVPHHDSSGGGDAHPRPSFSMGGPSHISPSKGVSKSLSTSDRDLYGRAGIKDTKTPVKAIKVPDEYKDMPGYPQLGADSGVLFEISDNNNQKPEKAATESVASGATGTGTGTGTEGDGDENNNLQVLVAEDDPINMKILRKRLERLGHTVTHAVNGQDCASNFAENSSTYDVVLMDMQMPIVDGLTSTKMIRAHERSPDLKGHSTLASINRRIPIFAVSASLIEANKDQYTDAGFDGWVPKPIDFKRLNVLLTGIHDENIRHSCLHVPGEWERGGWFVDRGEESKETTPKAEDGNKMPDMSNDADGET